MTAWIAGGASFLVATTAALLAYLANRRLGQRQDQLARINLQLEQFYGPLLALSSVVDAAWSALMGAHRKGRLAFFDGGPLTESDRELWVEWMRTVFMPANRKMYEIIATKAHLLAGDGDMPQSLLDFCAHVAGYEVVLKRWDADDYSTLVSLIEYPTEAFLDYVRTSFSTLRAQQISLIASTGSRSNHARSAHATAATPARAQGRSGAGRQSQ